MSTRSYHSYIFGWSCLTSILVSFSYFLRFNFFSWVRFYSGHRVSHLSFCQFRSESSILSLTVLCVLGRISKYHVSKLYDFTVCNLYTF